MAEEIIYLISIRGASSNNPGRKISELIKTWSVKHKVFPLFGGDLPLGVGKNNQRVQFGNENIHNSSFRNSFLWISLSELKDILHNFITLIYLVKIYKANNIKLIWERSSRLHWAGLILAKIFHRPYILEWKDNLITYDSSIFKKFALAIERYKILNADYIVVESKVLKEFISNEFLVPERKVFVAYNGVNYEDFDSSGVSKLPQMNSQKESNHFIVTYLGSFAFYHDSTRLVLAAKILEKDNPNIKIWMIGSGKDRQKCIDLAKSLKIFNKNLFFADAVNKDDVPGILSQTDIAVLPGSTDIICPVKIMEYMASGCIALAPNYPCNREIIKHNYNGVLFEPKMEQSIASEILRLSNTPVLGKEISTASKKFSVENLTWEATWGKTLEEILLLLSHK